MGIISKGILGGFSGTVGTVIGGSWKGIEYMRSQPAKRQFNPTPAQLAQQMKFALVMRFQESMVGLLRITFDNFANKMSGYNNAMSYNLKNTITGTYPTFSIDYSLALVSRGDLPNASGPAATAGTTGNINFSWTDNSGMGAAQDTDKAILVAYSETLNLSIYTLAGADRSAGAAVMNAATFSGQTVETYIGFISEDGYSIATSLYLGQVTVL